MAILAQKINLYSNAVNNTGLANIYTTQAEMIPNKPNLPVTAGGIDGFVQLDDVGAVNGTRGRVELDHDGKKYQICNQAIVPYGEKAYTAPGTFTFTVPAGISKIRVAVCGSSGAEHRTIFNSAPTQAQLGYGEASSFANLIRATGGGNGCVVDEYMDEGYHSWYFLGNGGQPNGKNVPPQEGWALGFSYAKGGYGQPVRSNGGAGGYDTKYLTITAGNTYQVTVGGNSGHITSIGGQGFVLVAWGGDIK